MGKRTGYSARMSETDVLVPLDAELRRRLDRLASQSGRSPTELAREAIANLVEADDWLREAIEEGLREAEAGLFLSEEEQAAAYKRWTS